LILGAARCAARWADSYSAAVDGLPQVHREGQLPTEPRDRDALIEDVVAWLGQQPGPLTRAMLSLFRAGEPVLDQRDGAPGVLTLSAEQFAEFERCLEGQGLPRDLYYPAGEQLATVDTIKRFGGVVRAYRRYTPRQWASRSRRSRRPPDVPSAEERERRFYAACSSFAQSVALRIAELSEPGADAPREAIAFLEALHRDACRAPITPTTTTEAAH
jgi:hypothetical protein